MSEERIAGQIIAIELDRLMEISESHAKQRAMESLAGRVKHQFPDCAMCKNLELHEDMDHMRYRRKYAVTCKNRPAYPGSAMASARSAPVSRSSALALRRATPVLTPVLIRKSLPTAPPSRRSSLSIRTCRPPLTGMPGNGTP